MERSSRARALLLASMIVAAAVGAGAWIDALRAGWNAVPPLAAAEFAELAARDGMILLPLVLASLFPVWIVSTFGERPAPLALVILGAWGAAIAVLHLNGFSIKVGWLAADLLAAVGAGWAIARAWRRRVAPVPAPSRRPVGAAAVMIAGMALWAAMGFVPAVTQSSAGGAGPALASA